MERELLTKLREWQENPVRKPLLLQGADRVGKSWLVERFAEESYTNYVYFRFIFHQHFINERFCESRNANEVIDFLESWGKKEIIPIRV